MSPKLTIFLGLLAIVSAAVLPGQHRDEQAVESSADSVYRSVALAKESSSAEGVASQNEHADLGPAASNPTAFTAGPEIENEPQHSEHIPRSLPHSPAEKVAHVYFQGHGTKYEW